MVLSVLHAPGCPNSRIKPTGHTTIIGALSKNIPYTKTPKWLVSGRVRTQDPGRFPGNMCPGLEQPVSEVEEVRSGEKRRAAK